MEESNKEERKETSFQVLIEILNIYIFVYYSRFAGLFPHPRKLWVIYSFDDGQERGLQPGFMKAL